MTTFSPTIAPLWLICLHWSSVYKIAEETSSGKRYIIRVVVVESKLGESFKVCYQCLCVLTLIAQVTYNEKWHINRAHVWCQNDTCENGPTFAIYFFISEFKLFPIGGCFGIVFERKKCKREGNLIYIYMMSSESLWISQTNRQHLRANH